MSWLSTNGPITPSIRGRYGSTEKTVSRFRTSSTSRNRLTNVAAALCRIGRWSRSSAKNGNALLRICPMMKPNCAVAIACGVPPLAAMASNPSRMAPVPPLPGATSITLSAAVIARPRILLRGRYTIGAVTAAERFREGDERLDRFGAGDDLDQLASDVGLTRAVVVQRQP